MLKRLVQWTGWPQHITEGKIYNVNNTTEEFLDDADDIRLGYYGIWEDPNLSEENPQEEKGKKS